MPFAPGEPDKLYERRGDTQILKVITGKLMCIYWTSNPVDYFVITRQEMDKKIRIEHWIQLN